MAQSDEQATAGDRFEAGVPFGNRVAFMMAPRTRRNGPPLPDAVSDLERMVLACNRISPRRSAMLGALLNTTLPGESGGRAVLRPFWAAEAMHRASSLIRLSSFLDRGARASGDGLAADLEMRSAAALTDCYRRLKIDRDDTRVSVSEVLRDTGRSMADLFGPAAGGVAVATSIERLCLPAFKRRALVLAANELIANALLHAFVDRREGLITVTLEAANARTVRLLVTDNGIGASASRLRSGQGVAADMASLLEGDVLHAQRASGGLIAEVRFPATAPVTLCPALSGVARSELAPW